MVMNWPEEWYRFDSSSFYLRPINLLSPHRWTGGSSVYGPMAYVWVAKFTLATQEINVNGQDMMAFISSLSGQANIIRIGDPARRITSRDRNLTKNSETWSDSTLFDDGKGFLSGFLPDFVSIDGACSKGGTSVVLRGLPESESRVFRRGDLIELRPGGIPTDTPNLYEVQGNVSTDEDGKTRVSILPPLRQGFAAGDMAVIRGATSVFRLVDDEQGVASVTLPQFVGIGFNLVEAIV